MTPGIFYQVSFEQHHRHLFDVRLSIPSHDSSELHISLPAWIPGSYMIRDFAKNIVAISAVDGQEKALPLLKNDKQSWTLKSEGRAVTISYQVYAFDSSVRTAYLDDERAFFNGTSLFLRVREFEHQPHRLELIAPADKPRWRVATGLERAEKTQKYAFGHYQADNYAELIDCPAEIGDFMVQEFDVAGVTHHLVLSGKHYADMPRICADIKKICQHHIQLFEPQSGKAPFNEYWFLTNILPNGFGGLEHKNSTALLCSNFDFATRNSSQDKTDAYIGFLSLVSHEYFHAWNVCRIKPEVFSTPDLSKETYTRQLWAYEGITSYYDDFSLFRCGLISFGDYLKLLQKTLTRVHRGPGQNKQSVSDSSFDAWTRFYQQGEDAINNIVSYYTKGSLIALWLDLTIRLHSQGNMSLNDLMVRLWQTHGKTAKGTTDKDFYDQVTALCDQQTADDLSLLLHQTGPIELAPLLARVGISLSYGPLANKDLLSTADSQPETCLGILYRPHPLGLEVTAVLEDSVAESAGIYAKDILLALDCLRLDSSNMASLVQSLEPDQPVTLHLFRNQLLKTTEITPTTAPALAVTLSETDELKSALWKSHSGSKN
ncbi:M61 family metallopeptidase [Lacimicrobium alkaliphilum]|uniref:PDZ domain-containing protein n=1 Tax=Lacimicrobium alkaliphilum TaxID=1526571 RepID=A0A0U2Z6P0_9ALTE|nr:M61 family metallopeptidase [Lacimicrobium alkaliphilum]ALS98579.1 hypothetical protein AT746_10085 [Lacimicrobium alkaliphilum]